MSNRFGHNLRRLVEEWQDYVSPSDLPVEHDSEGYGAFDDYAKDSEQEAEIPPSGEVEVFDAVQVAREAVRMLKKRGYRANDQVKVSEKAATSEFQRHPEPSYLDGGDASIQQFVHDYIAHMKGPKG